MMFLHDSLLVFVMLIRHADEHGELKESKIKSCKPSGTQKWCEMNFHFIKIEDIIMFIKSLLNMLMGQVTIYLSGYPFNWITFNKKYFSLCVKLRKLF